MGLEKKPWLGAAKAVGNGRRGRPLERSGGDLLARLRRDSARDGPTRYPTLGSTRPPPVGARHAVPFSDTRVCQATFLVGATGSVAPSPARRGEPPRAPLLGDGRLARPLALGESPKETGGGFTP